MRDDYKLQTVERTLQLLDLFTGRPTHTWSMSGLSKTLGIHKTTVLRMLATLEEHEYLAREGKNSRYRLGPSALALGGAATQSVVRQLAHAELRSLVEETRETALLHVISGTETTCIDKVESPEPVRVTFDIGCRGPIYAGSSGKSLLAFLEPEQLEQLLPKLELRRYTELTITDLEGMKLELLRIRERGYATSEGELDEGVCSVGGPIWNNLGELEAGIALVGPCSRWTEERWELCIRNTVEAAQRISHNLGYRKPTEELEGEAV